MAKTTHIICILDRSTSMSRQQDEVIRNFNKFLEEQQSVEGKAKLTLALFDTAYELVYDKVDIHKERPLNRETFRIQGATAMRDAIGKTLSKLINKKRGIVLIHTDGYENSSIEYSAGAVKELVDTLKKKWEFIFVGGDIDAQRTGSDLGIMRTAAVSNDMFGTQNTYQNFCATTTAYRGGGLEASAKVGLVENGTFAEGDTPDAMKDASGNEFDISNGPGNLLKTPSVFGGPLANGFEGLSEEDLAKIKEALDSKDNG